MLYLASRSPRRRELLQQIGLEPIVLDVDVDETLLEQESATSYVLRLAQAKALAAVKANAIADDDFVLAADTTVYAGGEILGKPLSFSDAQRIWALLPSLDHCVVTAVALWHRGKLCAQAVSTAVSFLPIPSHEQLLYWQTGEPCDKAGAYAVQGLAAIYITQLSGSYSNVVGLPLAETANLLRQANFPLWGVK
ncbi:MAG: Maf family protein [Moraxellaceae bacterium]|nr:Maf family protein [Moraxellaceae bacterium]MDP1775807.1 Maf family protein [Moraxellaceae bacterium]MDZ4297981.1 Maf family protein [Moraxellaceae bacterium]MDZ4388019.1 Maf family protein [Moraxellaceae bacterium]